MKRENLFEQQAKLFRKMQDIGVLPKSMHHEDQSETDEPELCAHCNGSGEGMYEGTKCYVCKGSGTDKASVVCGCYQCDDCQSTKGCRNE